MIIKEIETCKCCKYTARNKNINIEEDQWGNSENTRWNYKN